MQNQITCALGVFAGLLRRRFLAVTLFLGGVQAFFFAHVSLLGKCMPHEHPHDRRSAFLDSGSNVWAERIHCCIKGVCTAAVVAFLRLRRVFVSGAALGGFSTYVRAGASPSSSRGAFFLACREQRMYKR